MMKVSQFKPGSIIRQISTGHPYLVIQRLTNAIIVVDAFSRATINPMRVILKRDFDKFCDEIDLHCKPSEYNGEIRLDWEAPVHIV